MSLVETLRRARTTPATALHLFLLQRGNPEPVVHAFFEGQGDESFYMGFLQRLVVQGYTVMPYRCGSKASVYHAVEATKGRMAENHKTLFFVDKDLSNVFGEVRPIEPNLFVTSYYSIENYIPSEAMFRRVWREIFHLEDADDECRAIIERFNNALRRFYVMTRPITALLVVLRRKGLQPNYNNIDMGRLLRITVDLELVRLPLPNARPSIGYLLSTLGVPVTTIALRELKSTAKELSRLKPKEITRGKHELWFFVRFLDAVRLVLQSSGRRISSKTQVNPNTALEILAPRVDIPDDLAAFLRANGLAV